MNRSACLLATVVLLGSHLSGWCQDKSPQASRKLPNGVYAVLRDSVKEKEVLPLKDGESLIVHRHRYLKQDMNEPPQHVVVHSAPDVPLDLAGPPEAVKEGTEVVQILLKLQPKAASALETLTQANLGRQVAIVIGGEVVTIHKVRQA